METSSKDFVKQKSTLASVESQVTTNICEPTLSKAHTSHYYYHHHHHFGISLVSCHIGYTTKTNFVQHGHDV
jgi:hypothetical protein